MNRTRRPWAIGPFSTPGHYYVDGAGGFQVAEFLKREDADLAVRAVNSHDALVEALEATLLIDESNSASVDPQEIFDGVRAALALAKGADRG